MSTMTARSLKHPKPEITMVASRVILAQMIIAQYCEYTGDEPAEDYAISDLIGDLKHLSDSRHYDFREIIRNAKSSAQADVGEPYIPPTRWASFRWRVSRLIRAWHRLAVRFSLAYSGARRAG